MSYFSEKMAAENVKQILQAVEVSINRVHSVWKSGKGLDIQKLSRKYGKSLEKVWVFKNSLESIEKVWKSEKGLDIQKLSRKYGKNLEKWKRSGYSKPF